MNEDEEEMKEEMNPGKTKVRTSSGVRVFFLGTENLFVELLVALNPTEGNTIKGRQGKEVSVSFVLHFFFPSSFCLSFIQSHDLLLLSHSMT